MLRESINYDYKRSSKNKAVRKISIIYRVGNYIYYKDMNKYLKKIILKVLNGFRLFLVEYKYAIEMPFGAKIGDGMRLVHLQGIVIAKNAVIGKNCTIFHQVTIGANEHKKKYRSAPKLGDNVYIGAGAKIIGDIIIGNNVKIGANAIVTKSVPDGYTVTGVNNMFISKSEREGII